jgi:hypothetical protein
MSTAALTHVHVAGMLFGLVLLIAMLAVIAVRLGRIIGILRYKQSAELRLPFQNFAIAVAENEDLARVYYRGLQGFTGLSAEEQVRFFMIATLVFNYWNEVYDQNRDGVIPEATWERVQKMMRDFIRYPGVQEYWGFRRHWFSADVQQIIDALVRDAGRQTPSLYPEPSA